MADCYCFGPPVDNCPTHGKDRSMVIADDSIVTVDPDFLDATFWELAKKAISKSK